jgi:enoyl-CoA hydratase/3-hydroxyacyl-CoA dehydrogenase
MREPTLGDVDAITVVGAGTMGHGIAQVLAMAEYEVTLVDVDEGQLTAALEHIEASLDRLGVAPDPVAARITTTTNRTVGLTGADLMIEAVPEDIEIKREVFAAANDTTPAHAVLATNTSTLPITEFAAATDRPARVVGLHFSNPVPIIDVVEVIRGAETADATVELARSVVDALGKTPILVSKDVPGFVLNRINYAFWSEALRQVDTGSHDVEAVDAAVRRLGFPMGPFEVLDFAGLDVFHMACRSMAARGVPVVVSETHERLVEDGRYGMKTGAGFYEYTEAGTYERVSIPAERRYECNPYPMIASAVNAAAWLLDNDVASKRDIDRAMERGMRWPTGVLAFADEIGIDTVVETLDRLHDESGREQYEPTGRLREMVADGDLGVKTGRGFYGHEHERAVFDGVAFERRASRGVVTMPRPEDGGLDPATWDGLQAALERAATDDGVRTTILEDGGNGFALGTGRTDAHDGDTTSDESADPSGDPAPQYAAHVAPALEALRTHPKPTVALLTGSATGLGCTLLVLCDLAVAATGSRLGQPWATGPDVPPVWLEHGATAVGKRTLLELGLTDTRLPAADAAAAGMVNYAVSDDQARAVARELARATTAREPEPTMAVKRAWIDSAESRATGRPDRPPED